MSKIDKALALFLTLIVALSCLTLLTFKPVNALNSTEPIFDSTSVYGIDGYGVNLTISIDEPIFQANSTILSFRLQVSEPFNVRGIIVNPTDYDVSRKTLDFYLNAGALLDYDRSALIDIVWSNWADTSNESYVKEEGKLFSQNIWVNMSKLAGSYVGTAVLPKLEGNHNATLWIRAEQDQVTTYIPFWAAFPETITLINQDVSASPTVPEFSWLTILLVLLATLIVLIVIRRRVSWHRNK
jgi:hypothetical protein